MPPTSWKLLTSQEMERIIDEVPDDWVRTPVKLEWQSIDRMFPDAELDMALAREFRGKQKRQRNPRKGRITGNKKNLKTPTTPRQPTQLCHVRGQQRVVTRQGIKNAFGEINYMENLKTNFVLRSELSLSPPIILFIDDITTLYILPIDINIYNLSLELNVICLTRVTPDELGPNAEQNNIPQNTDSSSEGSSEGNSEIDENMDLD